MDILVEEVPLVTIGGISSEELCVECLRYFRPQEEFGSLDKLKQAIGRDVSVIREIEAHS